MFVHPRCGHLYQNVETCPGTCPENTIQTIILSYYNCILQQEKLNLLEDIVALSKERFLYEQTKNKIGISNILEFLQIENSLLTDSANLIMQKLKVHQKLIKRLLLKLKKLVVDQQKVIL